ncbi:hypothetical protein Sfum_1092 [Syntrophobacter fumaroxidans MPOB]|uniref:Uncharacterized protein n=1 Tax=Syntrophobacter fumaroxidans (strain DSM 10017 / MPOB) TaxID=335543 RepID=A0LH83_SYNFM|nr:hypothetical protein Sfum_1092 [Syntrophobacter fumaroxidans MPOB]
MPTSRPALAPAVAAAKKERLTRGNETSRKGWTPQPMTAAAPDREAANEPNGASLRQRTDCRDGLAGPGGLVPRGRSSQGRAHRVARPRGDCGRGGRLPPDARRLAAAQGGRKVVVASPLHRPCGRHHPRGRSLRPADESDEGAGEGLGSRPLDVRGAQGSDLQVPGGSPPLRAGVFSRRARCAMRQDKEESGGSEPARRIRRASAKDSAARAHRRRIRGSPRERPGRALLPPEGPWEGPRGQTSSRPGVLARRARSRHGRPGERRGGDRVRTAFHGRPLGGRGDHGRSHGHRAPGGLPLRSRSHRLLRHGRPPDRPARPVGERPEPVGPGPHRQVRGRLRTRHLHGKRSLARQVDPGPILRARPESETHSRR